MFFDPLYLLVMGIGLVLSLGAQAWVKSATSRWDRVALKGGMTGKDIAAAILRARGVRGGPPPAMARSFRPPTMRSCANAATAAGCDYVR